MADVWAVELQVRAVLENVKEIARQAKKAVEEGIASAKVDLSSIGSSILNALPRIPAELNRALKGLGNIWKGIVAGFPGGAPGIAGGIVAIATAILMTLKSIAELIKQGINTLSKASPLLGATRDILSKIWTMTLRPFGDFLAVLLRPVMILMLTFMRNFVAKAQPIVAQVSAGAKQVDEAWREISMIFYKEVIEPLKFSGIFDVLQALGVDVYDALAEFKAVSGDVIGSLSMRLEGFIADIAMATSNFVDKLSKASSVAVSAIADPEGLVATVDAAKQQFEELKNKIVSSTLPGFSILSHNLVLSAHAALNFAHAVSSAIQKIRQEAEEAKREKSFIEKAVDFVKGIFGVKQFGGPIRATGLYQLHAGEYVVPRERAEFVSGGNVSITINNPSIRKESDIIDLVREISRHLQLENRRRVSYGVF